MSRTAKVIAEFGGAEREFRLAWGELIELQEARNEGPAVTLAKLSLGQWQLQDVLDTIRLGLIGGGMAAADARKLVRTFIEERTFDLGGENGLVMLAVRVLAAATHGVDDEPAGKAAGSQNGSMISPTVKSDSAQSSATPS